MYKLYFSFKFCEVIEDIIFCAFHPYVLYNIISLVLIY
jgi:hypothetical protein